jgi:5-bromo-4-chloroindolyl phosphate hydrolysis protein
MLVNSFNYAYFRVNKTHTKQQRTRLDYTLNQNSSNNRFYGSCATCPNLISRNNYNHIEVHGSEFVK